MTGKRWLIPNFQKELFIVKQEMALQNVYLFFFFFLLPGVSLVTFVYFGLFIH